MKEQRQPIPTSASVYPGRPEGIPPFDLTEGHYRCRFAQSDDDLVAVLRLRYQVFNLELGEGLDASHQTGLDQDRFDAHCHHLMVEDLTH